MVAHVHGPSLVEMTSPPKVATPPTILRPSATGGQSFFFLTWFGVAASPSTPARGSNVAETSTASSGTRALHAAASRRGRGATVSRRVRGLPARVGRRRRTRARPRRRPRAARRPPRRPCRPSSRRGPCRPTARRRAWPSANSPRPAPSCPRGPSRRSARGGPRRSAAGRRARLRRAPVGRSARYPAAPPRLVQTDDPSAAPPSRRTIHAAATASLQPVEGTIHAAPAASPRPVPRTRHPRRRRDPSPRTNHMAPAASLQPAADGATATLSAAATSHDPATKRSDDAAAAPRSISSMMSLSDSGWSYASTIEPAL